MKVFNKESIKRIATAVKYVESEYKASTGEKGKPSRVDTRPWVQIAKVTDASLDANGFYGGNLVDYDSLTDVYTDYADIRLYALNGETVIDDNYYAVYPVGNDPDGEPVYVILGLDPGAGGSGSLTVEDIDSNPTYGTTVDVLQFDQADGFVITNPGAGNTVRIDIQSASATLHGKVDTTTQTFAGRKSFNTGGTRIMSGGTGGTGSSFGGLELHDDAGGTTFSTTDWVTLCAGLNDNNDFNAIIFDTSNAVGYLRAYWSGGTQMRVEAVSQGSGSEKAIFSINRAGSVTPGIDGTTGGGDTVVGGIITAVGSSITGFTNELAQDAVGGILVDTATIDLTYSDGTPSITADVINDSITFAKMQNISTDRLLGRDTAGSGDVEEISLGTGLAWSGAGSITCSITQYTDELAQDAVGGILTDTATIDFTYSDGTPSITADVINDSITFAKIQNITTDRLLGRDTASSGDVEEISLGTGLEFTGSTSIQAKTADGSTAGIISLSDQVMGAGRKIFMAAPSGGEVQFKEDANNYANWSIYTPTTTFGNCTYVQLVPVFATDIGGGFSVSLNEDGEVRVMAANAVGETGKAMFSVFDNDTHRDGLFTTFDVLDGDGVTVHTLTFTGGILTNKVSV